MATMHAAPGSALIGELLLCTAPLILRSVALSPRTIASYDAVLIATDHDGIDYAAIIDHAQIVIDTRNACARAGLASPKIVKA